MEGKREPLLAEDLGNGVVVKLSLSLRIIEFIEYLKLEGNCKHHPSLPLRYNYFYFLPTGKEGQPELLFGTSAFLLSSFINNDLGLILVT